MKKFLIIMIIGIIYIFNINAQDYTLQERKIELKNIIEVNENMIQFFSDVIVILNNSDNKETLNRAQELYNYAIVKNNELKTEYGIVLDEIELQKELEYPVATQIWNSLSLAGYNDYVIAGIIGNMMSETGGSTLNLKPYDYSASGNFYGICQWSKLYYPKVINTDLDFQIDFLLNTIEDEFKGFGKLYKKGFGYSDFLNLQDERQAALAFAKCYERCAGGYEGRMNNATVAYNYFVN